MKLAILLYGPSGVGKTTVAKLLCKKMNLKLCDGDYFKYIFSLKRSKERTKIGEFLAYQYALQLIERNYSIIIEAISDPYHTKIKQLLKRKNYLITKFSLVAPLQQCIQQDKLRKEKKYGAKVIKDVYPKYDSQEGIIIQAEGKTPEQVYKKIRSHLPKQKK